MVWCGVGSMLVLCLTSTLVTLTKVELGLGFDNVLFLNEMSEYYQRIKIEILQDHLSNSQNVIHYAKLQN